MNQSNFLSNTTNTSPETPNPTMDESKGLENGNNIVAISAPSNQETLAVEELRLEGFLFLPSYLESYEAFKKTGDLELARLFLDAVIAYGTQRKRITDNPLICAVMASVEKTIDAGAAKRAEKEQKKQARAAKRGKSVFD